MLCKLFLYNLRSLFLLHILVIQFQVSQNYNQVINVEMNRCCIKQSDGLIQSWCYNFILLWE